MNPSRKAEKVAVYLAGCTALAGLILLAYIGLYNRYWSDDWCYNRDFKAMGALGALRGYVDFPGGYSSNRYTLTLLSGLLYLLGLPGTQMMTALLIGLWLGGLYWNLHNLARLGQPAPRMILFTASALLLYFVLYFSPQRFQILYWRAGVMPYSAAIVAGLYVFAATTAQMLQEQPSRSALFFIAILAFLAGGFSEIGCALLFSLASLLFVLLWAARRRKQVWAVRAFPAAATALISLTLSMLTLILSPANARVAEAGIQPASFWAVPWLSLQAAVSFIVNALKTLPLPHAVLLTSFTALAILSQQPNSAAESRQGALWRLAAIAGTALVLLTAIQAPTIYFYRTPPDPRGQSLAHFVTLAGLALFGWEAGRRIVGKWLRRWAYAAAILILLGSSLYIARTLPNIYTQIPAYARRAELWDARDAYIRAAQAQGIRFLEVRMIDTADIDTRDLMRSKDSDKAGWIRSCAVEYYGLEGMKPLAP